jgi:hypothetical protein
VRPVRLRVDHHAAAQIDQTRVGIVHLVFLAQQSKTAFADLLHLHEVGLPALFSIRLSSELPSQIPPGVILWRISRGRLSEFRKGSSQPVPGQRIVGPAQCSGSVSGSSTPKFNRVFEFGPPSGARPHSQRRNHVVGEAQRSAPVGVRRSVSTPRGICNSSRRGGISSRAASPLRKCQALSRLRTGGRFPQASLGYFHYRKEIQPARIAPPALGGTFAEFR